MFCLYSVCQNKCTSKLCRYASLSYLDHLSLDTRSKVAGHSGHPHVIVYDRNDCFGRNGLLCFGQNTCFCFGSVLSRVSAETITYICAKKSPNASSFLRHLNVLRNLFIDFCFVDFQIMKN